METYEKYKPSGIDWIGEVPEHWEQCRFKNFIQLITKPSNSLVKIGLENIESGSGCFIQTDSEFEGSGVEFLKNDVVYGKLRPYLQKVWLASFDGNAVGDFFVFRVKSNSNATYLKYLLLSDGFTREADGATFGAKMPRVSSDFIMTLRYFLPPLAEQEAIAAYLDARCADIDKVVATQQKRIALLQELKQSEITQAVTRGLNPDARMKDSGVEWIGMVPEHWEVRRIKFSCQVTDGTHFSPPTTKEGMPYITVSNVYDDIIDLENANRISEKDFLDLVKQGCQPQVGDVLLAKDGTVGRTAIVRDNQFVALSSLGILHPMEGLSSDFLKYSLDSQFLQEQMKAAMAGSALRRITISKICEFVSFIPPTDEQNDIVEHLDRRCGEIDKQIGAVTKQIELLREYKQALITEVVTGKRRV